VVQWRRGWRLPQPHRLPSRVMLVRAFPSPPSFPPRPANSPHLALNVFQDLPGVLAAPVGSNQRFEMGRHQRPRAVAWSTRRKDAAVGAVDAVGAQGLCRRPRILTDVVLPISGGAWLVVVRFVW